MLVYIMIAQKGMES